MVFTTMGYWKEAKKVLTEFVKIFDVFFMKTQVAASMFDLLMKDQC